MTVAATPRLFILLGRARARGRRLSHSFCEAKPAAAALSTKKRTRSDKQFDYFDSSSAADPLPVMAGEVLDVFRRSRQPLRSFVDCTLGAAGHSSAIIQRHSELQLFVGLDIDPIAHEKAKAQINAIVNDTDSRRATSDLKAFTFLKNFKDIKSVLSEVDEKLLVEGVDGILMDLGMSSMQVNNAQRGFSMLNDGPLDMRMNPQASLKAEEILNSWPEAELGRILREYGEEANWYRLQTKILKARLSGGLHSTSDLVAIVKSVSANMRGGRQGWIKTAIRVFQALRIAVNDELNTLENSLYTCFDCLSSGGRLAVISFHSLEDRIVKQTFLDIINKGSVVGNGGEEIYISSTNDLYANEEEAWSKKKIEGKNGIILTKRPITPSEEEERLNRRCRSAKLRVVQKL